MSRIRTVKPEFFKHETLYDAEKKFGLPLRLAFVGLWTEVDREGRFEWRPRPLGSIILPYDGIDFELILNALQETGFIQKYTFESKVFGYIPTWKKHQIINQREPSSKLPEPPNDSTGTVPVLDRSMREITGTGTGTGTGTNTNTNTPPSPSARVRDPKSSQDQDFERVWLAYPKKDSKGQAEKTWSKIKPDAALILKALDWQRQLWTQGERRFIPNFSTYLNAKKWLDEPPYKKYQEQNQEPLEICDRCKKKCRGKFKRGELYVCLPCGLSMDNEGY